MIQDLIKGILIVFFFLLFSTNAFAAFVTDPSYYTSTTDIPASYPQNCTFPCEFYSDGTPVTQDCWNASTPGIKTSCGNVCKVGGGDTQKSWTHYVFAQTECRIDQYLSNKFFETVCKPFYTISGATCSTADKYNISSYGSGDTTMLRAGSCACTQKELFKTCCNGTTAVGTYNAGGNPTFPDGGCQFTTRACGSDPAIYAELGQPFTNVPCGTAACGGGTPPPATNRYGCSNGTCVSNPSGAFTEPTCGNTCNTSCPSFVPPATRTTSGSCPAGTTCTAQQDPLTVQTSCTPTGSQCSPSCSFTCRDSLGNTCPAKSCSTVWQCNGTNWYNGGQYYYTCPASCSVCTPGQTQTVCGTQQNQCRVP